MTSCRGYLAQQSFLTKCREAGPDELQGPFQTLKNYETMQWWCCFPDSWVFVFWLQFLLESLGPSSESLASVPVGLANSLAKINWSLCLFYYFIQNMPLVTMKLSMGSNISLITSTNKLHEAIPTGVYTDSKCPICLERFGNVAFLDGCFHRCCFGCVQE